MHAGLNIPKFQIQDTVSSHYKHIFGPKRCAYYEKSAYYECAYYEWAQYKECLKN